MMGAQKLRRCLAPINVSGFQDKHCGMLTHQRMVRPLWQCGLGTTQYNARQQAALFSTVQAPLYYTR